MSRPDKPAPFVRLAALQDLAATEHRRQLAVAQSETERRRNEEVALAKELAAAESNLDAIHAGDRFCPIRLRLAAAIVDVGEEALAVGRDRLRAAAMAEERAGADWLAARHRSRWFTDRARSLRKQEIDRRDDAAEREALMLRLASRRSGPDHRAVIDEIVAGEKIP